MTNRNTTCTPSNLQEIILTESPAFYGESTRAVHGGRQKNPYHAVTEPIVQTATYAFTDSEEVRASKEGRLDGRIEYGRYGNPTVRAAETRLAALEGAEDAILYASGMAAITGVILSLLSTGDHLILTDDGYRRTREFSLKFLQRMGIECTIVPMNDFQALEDAIRPETRLIVSESPTNPYLRVLDLPRLVSIARRHHLLTMIDSTFASPLNIRPLAWGVDLVVHSASKYLAGHNDLLAGVVAGKKELLDGLREQLGVLGGISDPHNANLLLRGIKTLGLRIKHQNRSGLHVARFLETHPKVAQVWYPGLASHADHELATAQMSGFGGVISFALHGDLHTTARFIDSLRLAQIATSLGGTETLVIQPALMTYYEYTSSERAAIGISDTLVRLSLGIEDSEDILLDLTQAFNAIP
jgi:cystathionine gamma-synthase